MILYNVPARTVADLQNDTVLRLAQVPGIIGIKDATANIERGTDLIRRAPRNFAIYSGEDATALPLILLRRPRRHLGHRERRAEADAPDVRRGAGRRREEGARAQPSRCCRCTSSLFIETSPSPVKWAMARDGPDRVRPAPAAGAAVRALPRAGARGAARGRHRAAGLRVGREGRADAKRVRRRWRAAAARLAAVQRRVARQARSTTSRPAQLPPLEVPPDLTTPARDNRYVVARDRQAPATLSGYQAERTRAARRRRRPRGAAASRQDAHRARRRRSAGWWCDEPPEKLWPVVQDFWQENGFLIKLELPEAGVMETDWAENRAKIPQDGVRDAARQAPRPGLLDLRARQVPHAAGAQRRRQRHRDLHQPPRHAGGLHDCATAEQRAGGTAWQPRPPIPDSRPSSCAG